MDIREVLTRFDGVKQCGDGQYMARCPCHDDRRQSLSIGRGEKGVVLKCQAGCDTRDVIARVGIRPRDLFYDAETKTTERPQVVAIYEYPGGVQKLRRSDKSFSWRRPDGKGGWTYNRQGVPHSLYIAGTLTNFMVVAEGEKDADNLHRLGFDAVSGADGAGPGKWRREYTEQLRGCAVTIFPDNDAVGKAYAEETAAALHGVAAHVRLCDLSTVWPEIPEHGDVSDFISKFGDEEACRLIADLAANTPDWTPAPPTDIFKEFGFYSVPDLTEEERRPPEFIIEGKKMQEEPPAQRKDCPFKGGLYPRCTEDCSFYENGKCKPGTATAGKRCPLPAHLTCGDTCAMYENGRCTLFCSRKETKE